MNCPYWQNAELHRVRKTKRPLSPRKANIKRCHCTGDVKGGLNDSLALVSSPEVACGFRNNPNHCGVCSLFRASQKSLSLRQALENRIPNKFPLFSVTGFHLDAACLVIFIVCILYTAIGGIKAVMWTDTFQAVVMFGSFLAIIIKGNSDACGSSEVFDRNYQASKIELFK